MAINKDLGIDASFDFATGPLADVRGFSETFSNGRRLVTLDHETFAPIVNSQPGDIGWALTGILAHETGHLLQGHTLLQTNTPVVELSADRFAGGTLFRLGATLAQAQAAVRLFAVDTDNASHGTKEERLVAIRGGWQQARSLAQRPLLLAKYQAAMTGLSRVLVQPEPILNLAERYLAAALPRPGEQNLVGLDWLHGWLRFHCEIMTISAASSAERSTRSREPRGVAFCSAGTLLAVSFTSTDPSDRRIQVHRVQGSTAPLLWATRVTSSAFGVSPDSRRIAYAEATDSSKRASIVSALVEKLDHGERSQWVVPSDIACVALSNREELLVASQDNGALYAAGPQWPAQPLPHFALRALTARLQEAPVSAAQFGPVTGALYLAGGDGHVCMVHMHQKELIWLPRDERRTIRRTATVRSMSLNCTETQLALVSSSGYVATWYRNQAGDWQPGESLDGDAYGVAVSATGVLAVGRRGKVQIHDPRTRQSQDILGPQDSVNCLAFSPDGALLAAGDSTQQDPGGTRASFLDGTVRLWEPANLPVQSIEPPEPLDWAFRPTDVTQLISDSGCTERQRPPIAVNADCDRAILPLSQDGSLFGICSLAPVGISERLVTKAVRRVAMSPDGDLIVTGSDDSVTRLLARTTRSDAISLDLGPPLRGACVTDLAFSSDGATLVAASDEEVRWWRLEGARIHANGGVTARELGCRRICGDCSVSTSGRLITVFEERSDTTIESACLVDTTTRKHSRYEFPLAEPLAAAVFSADEKTLYLGGVYGSMISVDLSGRRGATMFAVSGSGGVGALTFDPHHHAVISSDTDGHLRFFDGVSGLLLMSLPSPYSYARLAISRDGRELVGMTAGPRVRLVKWQGASFERVHEYYQRAHARAPSSRSYLLGLIGGAWLHALEEARLGRRAEAKSILVALSELLTDKRGLLGQDTDAWRDEVAHTLADILEAK